MAPLLKGSLRLSKYGQVQVDARTNTLIIADLPEQFPAIRQLLTTLDRAEPQVEIEARIITTTRDFARAIGVQWGLNGRMTPEIGNTTNLAFPNSGHGSSGHGSSADRGTVVNLPATASRGAAIGDRPRARRGQRRLQPRCRAVGARAHRQGPRALDAARDDAEQRRGRDHAGRADSAGHARHDQQSAHGHLQGRGADAAG